MLALSVTSAMLLSGSLANAQRPGEPVSGARPSRRQSSPPPPIVNETQRPTPGVPPAVAVPPASLLSPLRPSSPFEARPRTYAPRYAPRYDQNPRRGGYYGPYYSGGLGLDDVTQPATAFPPDDEGAQFLYPPSQATPAPVAVPHAPDTYYVIPGCYAGNRKPAPAELPKNCDVAKMKTTPVR
jgi:hypothetical protein